MEVLHVQIHLALCHDCAQNGAGTVIFGLGRAAVVQCMNGGGFAVFDGEPWAVGVPHRDSGVKAGGGNLFPFK